MRKEPNKLKKYLNEFFHFFVCNRNIPKSTDEISTQRNVWRWPARKEQSSAITSIPDQKSIFLLACSLSIHKKISGSHKPVWAIIPHSLQAVKNPENAKAIPPKRLADWEDLRLRRNKYINSKARKCCRTISTVQLEIKGRKANRRFKGQKGADCRFPSNG